jgi:hypothetical protein
MTPKRLFVLNAVIAGGYGIALLMARGPDPGDVVDCGVASDDRAEVAPRAGCDIDRELRPGPGLEWRRRQSRPYCSVAMA